MNWLLHFLSSCPHRRVTFPQTVKRRTWVSCLECGREFAYNWSEMRVGAELKSTEPPRSWRNELAEVGR